MGKLVSICDEHLLFLESIAKDRNISLENLIKELFDKYIDSYVIEVTS